MTNAKGIGLARVQVSDLVLSGYLVDQRYCASPYFSRDGNRGEWRGRRIECSGAIKGGDGRRKKNLQSHVVDTGQLGLGASKFRFAGKSYPLARFRTRQISLG